MATGVDRHETQKMLKEGAQLVEVLPPREYDDEHLPGAANIPLKALNRDTTRQLERGRPIIVYCHDYQ
jgi:rhodanese-related sulfurtransferase